MQARDDVEAAADERGERAADVPKVLLADGRGERECFLSQDRREAVSWQTKTVVRILMLVASILADDEALKRELKNLANHISAGSA